MDDELPDIKVLRAEWRRGDKGVWLVALENGNRGIAEFGDHPILKKGYPEHKALETWRATVTLGDEVRVSRPFKDFAACLEWADKQLYPRPTAWDRIRAV